MVAGSTAAWIALFVCLSSLSFQRFLWARFYALHALLFWLGAIGVYAMLEHRLAFRTKLWIGLGAGVAFLLAIIYSS